jgi:tetratricopeptide (TPR) repeat protein
MKKNICILFFLAITCPVSFAQYTIKDGLRALDFEKYELAKNIFTQLTNDEPNNPENFYYLGQAYYGLLDYASAKSSYEKGIAAKSDYGQNYAGLGELLLESGKKDEAINLFNKALSFSKKKQDYYTDMKLVAVVASSMVNTETKLLDEAEQLVRKQYEFDKKNYDFLIAAGDVYLERNDGGMAATFYERAIAVDPNRPKAYSKVAVIWLRVKNLEAAQNDLNKAFEKDPVYAPALKYQAELYVAQRNFSKAKEFYQKYLDNSEPSTANKIRYARILFYAQEYAEALNQINDILQKDKSNLQLLRLKGRAIAELNENKVNIEQVKEGLEALELFFSKIEPEKLNAFDYIALGKLQFKSGNDSLAINTLSTAIELNPNLNQVYLELAKIYTGKKNFEKAVASYEQYFEKATKPTIVDYFLYGKAAYFGKMYAKADSAFQKVAELNKSYSDAHYWRGNCLSGLDPDFKTDDAKLSYEKYIEMVGSDPAKIEKAKGQLVTAYSYLGYYYLNKDMNAKAKEYYKKVLELDPTNKNAAEVLKQIK